MRTMNTQRTPNRSDSHPSTYRTGLSLPKPLYQDALTIAQARHHRSFSGYIEYLIRRDRDERASAHATS
jgi:hypothetical protein